MTSRMVGIVFLAPIVACGGAGDAQDRAATPAAGEAAAVVSGADCGVLSVEAASRLMGESMQAGVERLRIGDPATGKAMLQCQHDATGSSASLSVQVQWNSDYDRPTTFAEFRTMLREQAGGSDNRIDQINREMIDGAMAVDGLGRFGYWLPDARTLTVHTGRGHAVTIGIARWGSGSTADADLVIARGVASTVLERL